MVDIHVHPHADGIGCHNVIDISRLIEGSLCVAGARGKCAHYHRGPTALAADEFGYRIDIFRREGDDC